LSIFLFISTLGEKKVGGVIVIYSLIYGIVAKRPTQLFRKNNLGVEWGCPKVIADPYGR